MAITIPKKELKKIIQESVTEAVEKEFKKLRISLIPYVSDEEQMEIEKVYGKKPGKEDVAEEVEIKI